jgi:hypothetical protein
MSYPNDSSHSDPVSQRSARKVVVAVLALLVLVAVLADPKACIAIAEVIVVVGALVGFSAFRAAGRTE